MGINYYKLVGYQPFWIYADDKYPKSHIEEILKDVSFNNKRSLKKLKRLTNAMSNEEHWIPTKCYQWKDVWTLTANGTIDDIADYIKVDVNGIIYYYYLVNKTETIKGMKDGKTYYDAVYEWDEYMTYMWNKLQILVDKNPSMFALMGMLSRWYKRTIANEIFYFIDYQQQKWISQTLSDRNNTMVRELAYYTNANDLYNLNFDTPIPVDITIQRYDVPTETLVINDFINKLQTPTRNGRYTYWIAKSTAKMEANNNELINSNTDQQFIIIPLFADTEGEVLKALNDFDKTIEGTGFLVPQGDNFIGLWSCDIPFSYFYGLFANGMFNGKFEYAKQTMGNNQFINVPFFTFDNNASMILKIIDYVRYQNGFYGKFLYMLNHIYEWNPQTEPAMWNPTYYKESYNNGEAQVNIDASMFSFKWSSSSIGSFGVEAYLSLADSLMIAYNFGSNTNTALPTYDNTFTTMGKGSITNMYYGSNSANYYTTQASTIATSLANRQSEEKQAWANASLNSASSIFSSIGRLLNPTNWINPANSASAILGATGSATSIARTMTNTAMEQERQNRSFKSSVNNIMSSPAQTLANPSVKGVVPNKYGLFDTYAIKLSSQDERVVFGGYTHNGYPINFIVNFNDVADNRKYMNILSFDTTQFEDDLMRVLTENDKTIFNTKFYNKRFLAWLNGNISIYDAVRLINCTDYLASDYVDNVEKVLPELPQPKEDINNFITNFRTEYEATEDFILGALMEDNPDAPSNIWEQIFIENLEFGGFAIKSLNVPDADYYGHIVVNTTCYNGYLLDNATRHYFWNVDFLCNTSYRTSYSAKSWTITCPDGTTYPNTTFNLPIYWVNNGNGISIPDGFLNACYGYTQDLEIPSNIISIGNGFLYDFAIETTSTIPKTLYGRQLLALRSYSTAKGGYGASGVPWNQKDINIYINCPIDRFIGTNRMLTLYKAYDSVIEGLTILHIAYGVYGWKNIAKPHILGTYADEFKAKFPIIENVMIANETEIYFDENQTDKVYTYERRYE